MNLEKNYINNLYIDIGNSKTKLGYLDINGNLIIDKILNNNINNQLFNKKFLSSFSNIYIGYTNTEIFNRIKKFLLKNKIKFEEITKDLFKNHIKINSNINWNEIGIDILSFCYLISHYKDVLCINFGTATVIFYYKDSLEGVLIGSNYIKSYQYLFNILKIDYELLNNKNTQDILGTNTNESVAKFIEININTMIDEIIRNYKNVTKIIVSGGDQDIFKKFYKNQYKKDILFIDEAVLKGFFTLISRKNKIF